MSLQGLFYNCFSSKAGPFDLFEKSKCLKLKRASPVSVGEHCKKVKLKLLGPCVLAKKKIQNIMHMLKLGHCVFKVCDRPLHGPPRQLTSFVLAIVTLKILHLLMLPLSRY